MPPLSDEGSDSDGPDNVPAKGPIPTRAEELAAAAPEEDGEDDDEDDDEGEEYRVERVLNHKFVGKQNELLYEIKWLGYDKKSDHTWEPIENLENAMDLVNEYHDSIGGAPLPPNSGKSSRKSNGAASSTPGKGTKRPSSTLYDDPSFESQAKKRRDLNGASTPSKFPSGTWEANVLRVHTVLEEYDPTNRTKNKDGKVLLGLIEWDDGKKTQHPLSVLRRKCPQKMLDYYEQHLVFRSATAKDNAQADAAETIEESL